MSDVVLDCHHHDITQIVSERTLLRLERKDINRERYIRWRDRLPHVADANFLKALKRWEESFDDFQRDLT